MVTHSIIVYMTESLMNNLITLLFRTYRQNLHCEFAINSICCPLNNEQEICLCFSTFCSCWAYKSKSVNDDAPHYTCCRILD